MHTQSLQDLLGPIDIYLLDQLLKGRITPGMKVLDAGCGGGRNLVYLMSNGFDVHAVDHSPSAIEQLRVLASRATPALPLGNIHRAPVETMPFADASFDVVISCAVLHFARDEAHWLAMMREMNRVLRPGGLFFSRLMSTIGIEHLVQDRGGRHCQLPDGSTMFCVDEAMLMEATRAMPGALLDPLKTTIVQNQRAMTTWVVRKG